MPNSTDHGRVQQPSTAIITGAEMTRVGQIAYNDRARLLSQLFNGTAGVLSGLSASATGADMVVTVGTGEGIDGDGYPIYVPAAVPAGGTTPSVTIAAADPTNPRIDVVYLQATELDSDQNNIATKAAAGSPVVYQDLHQTKLNYFTIHVAEGMPSGSPTAPAIPAGALEVCEVAVGAGVATISNADITDKRFTLPHIQPPGPQGFTLQAVGSLSTFVAIAADCDSVQIPNGFSISMVAVECPMSGDSGTIEIDLLVKTSTGATPTSLYSVVPKPTLTANGGYQWAQFIGAALPDTTSLPPGSTLILRVTGAATNSFDVKVGIY